MNERNNNCSTYFSELIKPASFDCIGNTEETNACLNDLTKALKDGYESVADEYFYLDTVLLAYDFLEPCLFT